MTRYDEDLPKIIENCFDCIVKDAGGERFDQDSRCNKNEKNADYVFQENNLVLELKTIITDCYHSADRQERTKNWVQANKEENGISPFGQKTLVEIDKLSPTKQDEFLKRFMPTVKEFLKKANSQIKSTKKTLGWDNSIGVLVLVNTGSPMLDPLIVRVFLGRMLNKKQFRNIDLVIYTTYNLYAYAAPIMAGYFCPWYEHPVTEKKIPKAILDKLYSGWESFSTDTFDPTVIINEIANYKDEFFNEIRLYKEKHFPLPKPSEHVYK